MQDAMKLLYWTSLTYDFHEVSIWVSAINSASSSLSFMFPLVLCAYVCTQFCSAELPVHFLRWLADKCCTQSKTPRNLLQI